MTTKQARMFAKNRFPDRSAHLKCCFRPISRSLLEIEILVRSNLASELHRDPTHFDLLIKLIRKMLDKTEIATFTKLKIFGT